MTYGGGNPPVDYPPGKKRSLNYIKIINKSTPLTN